MTKYVRGSESSQIARRIRMVKRNGSWRRPREDRVVVVVVVVSKQQYVGVARCHAASNSAPARPAMR